jgi:hypothetical protein
MMSGMNINTHSTPPDFVAVMFADVLVHNEMMNQEECTAQIFRTLIDFDVYMPIESVLQIVNDYYELPLKKRTRYGFSHEGYFIRQFKKYKLL